MTLSDVFIAILTAFENRATVSNDSGQEGVGLNPIQPLCLLSGAVRTRVLSVWRKEKATVTSVSSCLCTLPDCSMISEAITLLYRKKSDTTDQLFMQRQSGGDSTLPLALVLPNLMEFYSPSVPLRGKKKLRERKSSHERRRCRLEH